jgi:Calpain family cysteine protease
MSFWKRSVREDDRNRGIFTRARNLSRKRRLHLENLEERALLSTYSISESYINGVPIVSETVNSTTTTYSNPTSPFVVNTGTGSNTVNILNTSAHVAITVNSSGTDTVNVGNGGSVQGILAAMTVQSTSSHDTVNVNDSADATARTARLSTYSSGGANWGTITGLAPAAINYKYGSTSSVNVTTGTAIDLVDVLTTGVTTNVSTSGGRDEINVGNAGNAQGILGALYIQNAQTYDTVNVYDSADTTARTTILNTYSSGGANWGSITGLAPAAINYKYGNTSSVNIVTGTAADTVDVLATGTTTNITSSGGADVINVGSTGSVQGILGRLYLQNSPSHDTVNVYDSADTTARTATLNTYTSGAYNWGSITGLAPATINYKYNETGSVNLTTGTGADIVDVLATGVTTNITTSGGIDTINVGNAGSVQGIFGALYLQNPPDFDTINISDYADGWARTASLSTYASDGSNWGLITGLAPASINFKYRDTLGPVNVTTISGLVNWNVAANAMSGSTGIVVNDNGFPINSAPSEPTADASYSPAPAGTPLFSAGGPSYLDLSQGVANDCWLMASLAEVAARDPQIIRNMFTYDGTIVENGATLGLYTVRFFNTGGSVVSVQVDTELPSGGTYDDHVQNDLGTSCLWVALAEKAYAVANGDGYVTTNYPNLNSYDSLEFGSASWALHAITGLSASGYSINPTNVAAAWNAGDFIVMDTDSPSSSLIVSDHSYAVVGYNSSNSLPFQLFNPWGTDSSGWAPGHSGKIYGLFTANASFISHNFSEQWFVTGAMNGDNLATPANKLAASTALDGGYATFGTIDITRHRPGGTADAQTAAAHGGATTKSAPLTAINVDLLFAGDSVVGLDKTMSGFNRAWGGRKL